MVMYKIMFREKSQKKFFNFSPTIKKSAKPRYNQIDSLSKAKDVKKELEGIKVYKGRVWKIKKKRR